MKHNVISIVVDSVVWDCIGTNNAIISPTPFLDSLKSESLITTEMYSHGPYTDAATKSLYSGRNTLDDYSFFYKLEDSPINHFKVFHENGYETYGIYYPFFMYGPNVLKHIDHSYYTSHFIFDSEWHIFDWFADKMKEGSLEGYEYSILSKRIELMFNVWIHFYQDMKKNPESRELLNSLYNEREVGDGLSFLEKEYSKFLEDKNSYAVDFLANGHELFKSADKIDFDSLINREFINEEVFKKHQSFFNFASRLNRRANVVKNAPSLRRILYGVKRFIQTQDVNEIKFIANYYFSLRTINDMRKLSNKYEWQSCSSSHSQFSLAEGILRSRKSNKPFYLSLHVEEPHNYLACFTYDSIDTQLINEEIGVLRNYIEELGCGFKGNLLYLLSLRYVDYCIEKFCGKLKAMNLWDNTILLFVADHGSSYVFSPLHGARVNNFDKECYHIPMMIRKAGMNPVVFSSYCNSKDVLPTLMDIAGIEKSPFIKGHSLLDSTYKWPDYVMTEYPGPGCPQIKGKRLWFSIRNHEYMIGYRVAFYENFEDGELAEVYDLRKDPECFYNIAERVDRTTIMPLLTVLHHRFDEVCCNLNNY